MSKETRILGVLITDRKKEAGKIQGVLTKYGCSIKTRLGLHEATDDVCSTSGLLLLELTGDITEMEKLEKELVAIDGAQTQKMVFVD
jgi:transposase